VKFILFWCGVYFKTLEKSTLLNLIDQSIYEY